MSSALRWLSSLCFISVLIQGADLFRVELQDSIRMLVSLDAEDLTQEAREYAVQISGEPHTHTLLFAQAGAKEIPAPLQFNASYHGLRYSVSLLQRNNGTWSKPIKTTNVLTDPLPVDMVEISDYGPAPETGVVFHISSPDRNVYTRVNISYSEARQTRHMLYKDFLKGKTVFRHWLPGVCYSNITFQLVSEVTVNKSSMVARSDITHPPLSHRTVPNPPLNVSVKIIHLSDPNVPGHGHRPTLLNPSHNVTVLRKARDLSEEPVVDSEEKPSVNVAITDAPLNPVVNFTFTAGPLEQNSTEPTANPASAEEEVDQGQEEAGEEEFVNAVLPEYEDSNEPGSALDMNLESSVTAAPLPPLLLELHWMPPRAPTAYDAFTIYITRDGNATETATVDENTQEFFSELTDAGTYHVRVTTLSFTGDCEARESSAHTGLTFFLSEIISCTRTLISTSSQYTSGGRYNRCSQKHL